MALEASTPTPPAPARLAVIHSRLRPLRCESCQIRPAELDVTLGTRRHFWVCEECAP